MATTPVLQAVLLYQHHKVTSPHLPHLSMLTGVAAQADAPQPPLPPPEEDQNANR